MRSASKCHQSLLKYFEKSGTVLAAVEEMEGWTGTCLDCKEGMKGGRREEGEGEDWGG